MSRRQFLATGSATTAVLAIPLSGHAASLPRIEVWKDRNCGCCQAWVEHLRGSGFVVNARDVDDMAVIKRARRVPEELSSCHTAIVQDYVIEGHVPADDVKRLLKERPKGRGLAVPGMPMDAPGMDGKTGEPYQVFLFGDFPPVVFARH